MGILDTAKDIVEVIRKIDNIELYKKVLDLNAEILKLYEENTILKQEVRTLEDKFRTKEALIHDQARNSYWLPLDNGKDGPFCVHCWDTSQQLVRLHKGEHYWWCLTHKQQFQMPP